MSSHKALMNSAYDSAHKNPVRSWTYVNTFALSGPCCVHRRTTVRYWNIMLTTTYQQEP